MKSTGGPKYPIWLHFLTSALSTFNERELAIIVATFCLEEFLQAGSEDKASRLELQASQELNPGPGPQE